MELNNQIRLFNNHVWLAIKGMENTVKNERPITVSGLFDYIEMFYNPTRNRTNNGMMSPVDYEIKQAKMNEAGV